MKDIIEKLKQFYTIRTAVHMRNWYNNTDTSDNINLKLEDKTGNRIRLLLLLFLLSASWAGSQFLQTHAADASQLQKHIANEIIRFHVIANSDSQADQELKLKVKDALVTELAPYLKKSSDITESRQIILSKLSSIQDLAENIIVQNGYNYPVKVSLEECYFPLKVYGDYTFPPGDYEALRVQIGEASGKNWWCVMFPPMCFVDETYTIVDEDSEKQLKHLLTEEEFETIKSKKVPVKVKFKLWKSIKKLFH